MSDVWLLFVGAVLIVNGIMLLGLMTAQAAAPLNFFIGTLHVVTPTFLIMTAGGDREVWRPPAGSMFGFTYLWVGINTVTGWPGHGLGWSRPSCRWRRWVTRPTSGRVVAGSSSSSGSRGRRYGSSSS